MASSADSRDIPIQCMPNLRVSAEARRLFPPSNVRRITRSISSFAYSSAISSRNVSSPCETSMGNRSSHSPRVESSVTLSERASNKWSASSAFVCISNKSLYVSKTLRSSWCTSKARRWLRRPLSISRLRPSPAGMPRMAAIPAPISVPNNCGKKFVGVPPSSIVKGYSPQPRVQQYPKTD